MNVRESGGDVREDEGTLDLRQLVVVLDERQRFRAKLHDHVESGRLCFLVKLEELVDLDDVLNKLHIYLCSSLKRGIV